MAIENFPSIYEICGAKANAKSEPQAMKILIALANNLRASAKNQRQKQEWFQVMVRQGKSEVDHSYKTANDMDFQARAMHHALYNAFFLAKKAAGRK